MPYIKQSLRDQLDPEINRLAGKIRENSEIDDSLVCGLLNYAISQLIIRLIKIRFDRVRYWIINMVSGTLSNVQSEFYDKVARSYEDEKIDENGDLDWKSITKG